MWLWCESTTPFGVPVEPDVYRNIAGSRACGTMGVEAPGIEEAIEAVGSIAAEMNRRQVGWNVRAARRIAEHELRAGIAEDEMDGLAGKLEIHRHRNQARAHDAVIGREIFGAIGGEDGNAIAACKAAL